MPAPVRQTRTAFPSVKPHCELSFRAGLSRPWSMISGRLWRANATFGPADRAAVPRLHVDAAVAVGDEGREARLERLVRPPVDRRSVAAVAVDEAAVERREQAPALAVGHRHRPAHRRVRRLVAARVPRDGRARVVEPRDVGDDPRIVDLRPERRDEHRRPPAHHRPGAPPHPLAGQRVREHGLDLRRRHPRGGGAPRLRAGEAAPSPTVGRRLSCGPPLSGAFQL